MEHRLQNHVLPIFCPVQIWLGIDDITLYLELTSNVLPIVCSPSKAERYGGGSIPYFN